MSERAPVVDDAMVERGMAGYQREWDRQEEQGSESVSFRTLVRAALIAALASPVSQSEAD